MESGRSTEDVHVLACIEYPRVTKEPGKVSLKDALGLRLEHLQLATAALANLTQQREPRRRPRCGRAALVGRDDDERPELQRELVALVTGANRVAPGATAFVEGPRGSNPSLSAP